MKNLFLVLLFTFSHSLINAQNQVITLIFEDKNTLTKISMSENMEDLNSFEVTKNGTWKLLSEKGINVDNISIIDHKNNKLIEQIDISGESDNKNIDITIGMKTALAELNEGSTKVFIIDIDSLRYFIIDVKIKTDPKVKVVVDIDDRNDCDISSFIPDISIRSKIPKNILLSSYTYIFDIENNNNNLFYFKAKKNKVKYINDLGLDLIKTRVTKINKNFNPKAGKEISFYVINNHSKYSKFTIEKSSVNFNVDEDYGLGDVLNQEKSGSDAAAKSSGKSRLINLYQDLIDYKDYITKYNISNSQLESDKSFIRTSVSLCYSNKDFNLDSIQKTLLTIYTSEAHTVSSIMHNLKFCLQYNNPTLLKQMTIPDADVLEIDLKAYEGQNEKTLAKKKLYPSLGFKIDYSGGLIYSNLFNESYEIVNSSNIKIDTTFYVNEYFEQTDSITGISQIKYKKISKKAGDEFTIGVGAFAHFYPRISRSTNLAISLGAIIDNNISVQYLLGGSLLFKSPENRNRLAVSVGASFGQMDVLRDEKYKNGKDYDPEYLDNVSNDQLTVKKWKSGYFAGITWNFGK